MPRAVRTRDRAFQGPKRRVATSPRDLCGRSVRANHRGRRGSSPTCPRGRGRHVGGGQPRGKTRGPQERHHENARVVEHFRGCAVVRVSVQVPRAFERPGSRQGVRVSLAYSQRSRTGAGSPQKTLRTVRRSFHPRGFSEWRRRRQRQRGQRR